MCLAVANSISTSPAENWGSDGKHRRPGAPSLLEVWGFSDGIDNAGKMDGAGAYKHQPRRPEPYFAFLEQRHLAEACIRNFKILDHDYPGPSILPDDAYCDNWIARNGLAPASQRSQRQALVPAGELQRAARSAGRDQVDVPAMERLQIPRT